MGSKFPLRSRILISAYNSTSLVNIKSSYKFASSSPLKQFPSRCFSTNLVLHQASCFCILRTRLNQLNVSSVPSREKSYGKRRSEYESESDSDDEMIEQIPGAKVLQIQTDSLRCDMIVRQALGIARNKFEVLFYEGRIRVNGEKMEKKSHDVELGDETDVIKNVSSDNPNFILVSRVEVIKARPSGDIILLTIRRQKSLLIENYEKHPWEEPAGTPE